MSKSCPTIFNSALKSESMSLTSIITKKSVLILLLLGHLFLAALPAARGTDAPIVLVLAGQSNMGGQGDRSELEVSMKTLPATVELIVEGKSGSLSSSNSFGPEVALAHELAAARPHQKFKLLKFSIGSTSIRAWAPEWSEDAAKVTQNEAVGALYPRLLDFVHRNLGEGDVAPHAVLWFQGERDSRYAMAAADYGPRLDQFIQCLRRDLPAPNCWFVLGIVNPLYPHTAKVAGAQRETPQRLAKIKLVESDGLTKRSDSLHYNTAGQLELGRRYAREILSTLPAETTGVSASKP